ncbi:MAG: family 43 glycosylhydrolase [Bacteroidaceae bacterium]|nr:family 43 glycosylhydrolase [Bacteroidaceae bacterium]
MKRHVTLIIAATIACSNVFAQGQRREYTPSPVKGSAWNAPNNTNPFIPGYFADPTIRKFGNTYYVYATTDGTGNGYGPAQVWVSYDFTNWKNIVMNWPTTEVVWAPDVVQQPDGRYRYFYCEPCNINIGESDSPIGPWTNILGKENAVMVPDRFIHNVITLDPQLFRDDDGSQYLYFTTWGIYKGFGCGVVKLNEGNYDISDLQKLRDARYWNENNPYPIAADKFFSEKKLILNDELKDIFEAPFVFKRNGTYYFTYSSGSCHTDTYRVQYAISRKGPMGPFEYKGEILTTNTDETVHGPGHHSIIEENGEYYIVYHRHNNPKSIHGFNRQVCIDKLEFDAQGNIKKVVPTHDGINPLSKKSSNKNLAFGAKVTASSYYDEWFKPEYAADDNNATLWKARHTTWDSKSGKNEEWLMLDLGKTCKFNEIWTQFEYATFFYQYKIETSIDGNKWNVYADKTDNVMQGSPMIDQGKGKARYIRLTITDTQKNGHFPAVWNIKVWNNAPKLPYENVGEGIASYPGMHKKDVSDAEREQSAHATIASIDALLIKDSTPNAPFDITEIRNNSTLPKYKKETWTANKPIHVRVKDGKWALFFNGTQKLTSSFTLPNTMCYNAPYTICATALSTNTGAISTIASLSSSRADLANTELRLGSEPSSGLVNHNGSFESCGASDIIKAAEGKWHNWVVTFDGWKERVYLDGKQIHEQNNFIMVRPDGRITIGSDSNGTHNFMGYLCDLSIMNYSVTPSEVGALYQHRDDKYPSLGDDDFEEIDPDSKFVLNPALKQVYSTKEAITLSADNAMFNDSPLQNGGQVLQEIEGDFVMFATVDDMEGLASHSVKGFNEGGLLIADNETFYQFGAFPLYNCGNMLTILSKYGRPQYPNYKGYNFDRIMQFERKGDKLYARSSSDGKTWNNAAGSPIEVHSKYLKLGIYQTTYTDAKSWVKLKDISIWK